MKINEKIQEVVDQVYQSSKAYSSRLIIRAGSGLPIRDEVPYVGCACELSVFKGYLMRYSGIPKSMISRKCEERGISLVEMVIPVDLGFRINHPSFETYHFYCNWENPKVAAFLKECNLSGTSPILMSGRYTPHDFRCCVDMPFDEWLDSQKDGGTNNGKVKDVTLK